MVMVTDCLLLATGFTGALTLRFLWRMLCQLFVAPPSVLVHLATGTGSLDPLRTALKRARREVLVLARSFAARPIAQALVEAKMRGLNVELLLDAACERDRSSDVAFFLDQGLPAQVSAAEVLGPEVTMLIDGRTILAGGFASPPEEGDDSTVNLLEIKGHPEVLQTYRQLVQDHRSEARPAQKPQPAQPAPKPHPAPAEQRTPPVPASRPFAPVTPPPQPAARTVPAPAPAPQTPPAPPAPAPAPRAPAALVERTVPAAAAPAPRPQPAPAARPPAPALAPAAARPAPAPAAPTPAPAPAPAAKAPSSRSKSVQRAAAPAPAPQPTAEEPPPPPENEPEANADEAETPLPPGFDFAALRRAIQGAA